MRLSSSCTEMVFKMNLLSWLKKKKLPLFPVDCFEFLMVCSFRKMSNDLHQNKHFLMFKKKENSVSCFTPTPSIFLNFSNILGAYSTIFKVILIVSTFGSFCSSAIKAFSGGSVSSITLVFCFLRLNRSANLLMDSSKRFFLLGIFWNFFDFFRRISKSSFVFLSFFFSLQARDKVSLSTIWAPSFSEFSCRISVMLMRIYFITFF